MVDEKNNEEMLPESFDWNETDTTRQYPQLAEDFYKGVILKAKKQLCPFQDEKGEPKKDIGLEITVAPVDGDDHVQKVSARGWFGIPVSNPKVPGHKVSTEGREFNGKEMPSDLDTYYRRDRELIRAVEGDEALPRFPKKRENSDEYFDPSTGETVTVAERKAKEKEVNDKTLQKMKEYYLNPEKLVGTIIYFAVKRSSKGYANIQYVRHDDGGKAVRVINFTE